MPIRYVVHVKDGTGSPCGSPARQVKQGTGLELISFIKPHATTKVGVELGSTLRSTYAVVVKCVHGGLADMASLRAGDEVHEINGISTAHLSAPEAAALLVNAEGEVTVKVQRGETESEVVSLLRRSAQGQLGVKVQGGETQASADSSNLIAQSNKAPLRNMKAFDKLQVPDELDTARATSEECQEAWGAADASTVILLKHKVGQNLGVILTSIKSGDPQTWVRSLSPHTPAYDVLRVGDQVISVNDVVCKGAHHASALLRDAPLGEIQLCIRRIVGDDDAYSAAKGEDVILA